MNYRDVKREFDRMAAQRMRLHTGGLALHIALGNGGAVAVRFKLKRMGLDLKRDDVKDLIQLVDDTEIQSTLSHMPLSVRYATVSRPKTKRRIWGDVESKDNVQS